MTEPATPEAALQQAQKSIQSGDFQTASKITSEVLAQHPQHRDALYMAAVCARYQNRHDDAFARLADLKLVSPDYGRAWQEEGHLRRKLGDLERMYAEQIP